MKKLNKKTSGQEYFTLEEVYNLLENEGKNIKLYIQEGYLKVGEDLKVKKDDLAALIDHLITKSQNKQKRFTPRGTFIILWLATITSFIFTIDTSNPIGKTYHAFFTTLFLGNILIGITAFLLVMFSNKILKHFRMLKFIPYIPLVAIVYLLFYVTSITAMGHGLIASNVGKNKANNITKISNGIVESLPITTNTPTSTPAPAPPKPAQKAVYVDPDPTIDCNFPKTGTKKLKKSECSISFDCELGSGSWYVYTSHDKCKQDQDTYWKNYYSTTGSTNTYIPPSNTNSNEVTCEVIGYSESRKVWTYILTPQECDTARANYPKSTTSTTQVETTPSYPPCTVYYSALNFSSTFNYMSPEECKTAQDEANSGRAQNYDSAVSACLNRMRAAGAANSSAAQACYSNPSLGL